MTADRATDWVMHLLTLCLLPLASGAGSLPGTPSAPGEPPAEVPVSATAPAEPTPGTEATPADAWTPPPARQPDDPYQAEAWQARRPKTVIEDQPYRRTSVLPLVMPDGRWGTATLFDLNPAVHAWYLLRLSWNGGTTADYHLENSRPDQVRLRLDQTWPLGVVLQRGPQSENCDLWGTAPSALQSARLSGQTYASLCGGWLALRNPTEGRKTTMEWTTDFLRDHVWGGEKITVLVREEFFQDSELKTSELGEAGVAPTLALGPAPARIDPAAAGRLLDPVALGLPVEEVGSDRLLVGAWYPVAGVPGTFTSIVQARFIDPAIATEQEGWVSPLAPVESGALVYTIAFDLDEFDLGFELGTDHPRVGWSDRALDSVRDPRLAGPDGFDTIDPLVRTGQLDPAWLPRLVSVFAGGFKRGHGAFKSGPYATRNQGSHYGFVEHGVELSRLQPGLATVVVWVDGRVELRTWTEADADRLWAVRHARQNGVPILAPDPETGEVHPGDLVKAWSAGNWSGSQDGHLRAVRASLCTQSTERGRFLLYSYFSSATPSAMARVLAAYGCDYAVHTDMNALEHTYLAIHAVQGGELRVHHLVRGMEVLDKERGGASYPRFVGFADNRDFFYVLRKERSP